MSRDKRKWRKIMEKVQNRVQEESLETGLEHWRLNRKMRKRAGRWKESYEILFKEMEEAVENGDREKAEHLSSQLKAELKADTVTD